MVVRGHRGHGDPEMIGEVRKRVNKTSSLYFWRVDFGQDIGAESPFGKSP